MAEEKTGIPRPTRPRPMKGQIPDELSGIEN